MQIDRWQHVQDLYFRALEMPEIRRTPFLRTECENDPRMQQEVESLLECEDKVGDFLETMPMDVLGEIVGPDLTTDDEDDDLIGTIIDDRYVVTQRVGSGGMGEVYRADHRLLGTPVAIKRLAPKFRDRKDHRQRFLDEARRATLLDHENITRMKDVVEQSNEVFMVMEFIDGQTLRAFRDSSPSLDEFVDIAIQCASGLASAHARGIAHLDIKPANIMLTAAGRVKICDFGVARQMESHRVANGREEERWTFGGTPAYMAPEVLESNRFDVRADVFSMGVVFYELLSGTHPFWADDVRVTTNRIVKDPPPPLKRAGKKPPARLVRLIGRMLLKDPTLRPTPAATVGELQAIRRRLSLVDDVRRAPAELVPLVRRRPWATLGIVLALILGAVGLANMRPSDVTTSSWVPPKRSMVAVLPCDIDGEQSQTHAERGRGVAELLALRLAELTSFPNLRVSPPDSLREYEINSTEKARMTLGATLIVRCSLSYSKDKVTFSYFLESAGDGPNDSHILKQGRLSSAQDNSEFSERITQVVAATLEVQLEPSRPPGTENDEAFRLYREGLGFLYKFDDPESLDKAVSLLSRAVEQDPSYAAAFAALGKAYAYRFDQTQNYDSLRVSLENCQKAEGIAPDTSETQVCLGRVYLKMGVLPSAEETLQKALRFSATNDEAMRLLGLVYERQNRRELAKEHYIDAIKQRGDWQSYSWLASFYVHDHEYQKAREYYELAKINSPGGKNARVLYSMGGAYGMAGEYAQAIRVLEDSNTLLPNQYKTLSNLGMAYWKAGQNDRAISAFGEAVKVVEHEGGDHAVLGNLARVYWSMNQMDKARDFYTRAIATAERQLENDRDNPAVHILLGRYYAALNRPAEAKAAIDLALHHSTRGHANDPHYLVIAATAYALLDEKDLALHHLDLAAQHHADRIEIVEEPELKPLKNEPKYKLLIANLK